MENNSNNRKPFVLSEALAGKPVVNGKGDTVFVTQLSVARGTIGLLSQYSNGTIAAYHVLDGGDEFNYEFNLFMAPVERTVYVNLYHKLNSHCRTGYFYDTEEQANSQAATSTARIGGKAHPITILE